jgi:hypothetical protein
MRAINISPKFILRFVHSVVGLDYYPWQGHTRILASPPEITAPRFASNRGGKSIKTLFHPQKRGQFEAESVLGDGHSRTGGIPPDDIVRSGTVRNFDVRNRSRTRL